MRELLDIAINWPMPAVWLIVTGVVLSFVRPRAGRFVVAVAAALLIILAIPAVSRVLGSGLAGPTTPYDPRNESPPGVSAVVVFTAGIYQDARGQWHPERATVRRTVVGDVVAEGWGLPLLIAGGAPDGRGPPEAVTVALSLGLDRAIIESSPRNTDETGRAIAARLVALGLPPRVVVVTDGLHIARATAALRHAGVAVPAAISATAIELRAGHRLIPSRRGLLETGRALYEYVAIAVYLARGQIDLDDL